MSGGGGLCWLKGHTFRDVGLPRPPLTLLPHPSCSAPRSEGGAEGVVNWGEVLSLGEQQRLGMARLFWHRPRFGVLDECTNATSVDVEERLYQHAAGLGITLVTITQVRGGGAPARACCAVRAVPC